MLLANHWFEADGQPARPLIPVDRAVDPLAVDFLPAEMTCSGAQNPPYIEAMKQGRPLPDFLRKGEGFGTAEDCAALIPYLASDAARAVTGQCIGIGGDKLALWSHPQEAAVAYADGGWTPQAIAATWATSVGREPQTVGIPAPVIPEGGGR